MTIADIFDKGGFIVYVLSAYVFIALLIMSERLLHYFYMGKPLKDFESHLQQAIVDKTLHKELQAMQGPEARLMLAIYQAKQKHIHDLQSVASRCGSVELRSMQRGFRSLSILGNTAPLLGLLGTIIGMIKAFMVIELAGGQVDAQALAGGIWEAMLTTGVGLVVSIPVLLVLHFLESIADRRSSSMRYYAMLLLESLPPDDLLQEDLPQNIPQEDIAQKDIIQNSSSASSQTDMSDGSVPGQGQQQGQINPPASKSANQIKGTVHAV